MINPDDIIAVARATIHTPFVAQGRSPAEGLDCTGLVLWSFKQAGWGPLVPDVTENRQYRTSGSDGRRLLRVMRAECVQVATTPRPADILLIRWKPDLSPMHCAIVTQAEPLHIIHTSVETGKVSEHPLEPRKMWQVHSVWRCRALC